MIAIVGGLVTAVLWAATLLGSARASRMIGSWSTLGWVMIIGLAVTLPLILVSAPNVQLTGNQIGLLTIAGVSNSSGLLLVYTALRRGKVAVVGPIVSTEGAIGAVFAILAGDPIAAGTLAILAVIAFGVVLASIERSAPVDKAPDPARVSPVMTAAIAFAGALLFGANLFATSRVAGEIPLAWTILPARLAGAVGVTLPLLLTGRLRLVRAAVPFVVLVGLAEVAGIATYAIGSTDSAAVAAVLASQFAAIAAVAAFFLWGERLGRLQIVGVAIIVVGVSVLAFLQAG